MESKNLNTAGYEMLSLIRKRTENFMLNEGRRPRVLATTIGDEQQETNLKAIATSYADFGFDVDINPASQTPELVARSAVEIDVHLIIISTKPDNYSVIVPQISDELSRMGGEEIKLLVVGDVPSEDRQPLFDSGVIDIIESQGVDPDSAGRLLDELDHMG